MAEKIVNIADSVTVGELAETLGLSVTTLNLVNCLRTESLRQLISD